MLLALADWVLIRKERQERKTASGIIIAESSARAPYIGRVEAVGRDVAQVQRGDLVAFSLVQGFEWLHENEPIISTREKDVFCVLERPGAIEVVS